jgi:hypothetical protein
MRDIVDLYIANQGMTSHWWKTQVHEMRDIVDLYIANQGMTSHWWKTQVK